MNPKSLRIITGISVALILIATGILLAAPPAAPTGFFGDTPTVNSITWHWNDVSSDEDGFEIQETGTDTVKGSVGAGVTSYAEPGLGENTQYTRHCHSYALVTGPGDFTDDFEDGVLDGWTTQTAPTQFNNVTIHMNHTAYSAYENPTSLPPLTEGAQVYSGTVTVPLADGWFEINLDTPFNYDNINNLVVTVGHATGTPFEIYPLFRSSQPGSYMRAYALSDVGPPASWTQSLYRTDAQLVVDASTVTLGTGSTGPKSGPLSGSVGYSKHQLIYLQSEIGLAGSITKLRFYRENGPMPWTATTSASHAGSYSARSGAIADAGNSGYYVETYMERTFIIGAGGGNVSYWRKVSSELNYDYFYFYIDGFQQEAISGEVDWATASFALAEGTRTLKWSYVKDMQVIGGSDCVWIDDVVVNVSGGPTEEYSGPSNDDAVYTAVHDPLDSDFTVATLGNGQVRIDVVPPPNSTADFTGVKIERDENGDFLGADYAVVQDFAAVYSNIVDTVPAEGTYYYRIIFQNGDEVPTTPSNAKPIYVQGELGAPLNFGGTGVALDQIEWAWNPPATGTPDGYQLEDESSTVIGLTSATTYLETVSGENTPATRQLRSAVFGTTTIEPAIAITGGFPWPWNDTGRHMQMIYLANELFNQAGNINKIHWRLFSDVPVGGSTFNNVVLLLGHTTNSTLLSQTFASNFTENDATEVWNTPTYTVASGFAGDWVELPITDTFYYNGTNNLILDIDIVSGTTDLVWTDNNGSYPNGSSLYANPGETVGDYWNVKYLIQFDMDIVSSTSTDFAGPETVYSLVHNATLSDFTLTPGGAADEVDIAINPPPNQDAGLTGVKVERAEDNLFTVNLATVQNFTNNYALTDSGLAPGVTYWYRITFCNGDGIPSLESPGDQITTPGTNTPPVVAVTTPASPSASPVTITYDLTDTDGDNCEVSFDYSINSGSTWASCTAGGGDTNPLTGVSPASGLTFQWNVATDLPGQYVNVMVRVSADDGRGGTHDDSTAEFSIDTTIPNTAPVVAVTTPASPSASPVTILYNLTDADSDNCDVSFDYSINSGSSWASCTAGGGDTNPLTSVAPGTGLTFSWDAATDLPGQVIDVMVRVSVDDSRGGTHDNSTAEFALDTTVPNTPPVVAVTTPASPSTSPVTITYDLTDGDGNSCTVSFDYSVDSGSSWASCTADGGDSNPQTSVAPGSGLTFNWDAAADLPDQYLNVMVRVSADDGYGGTHADSTAEFSIDTVVPNTPPVVAVTTPASPSASPVTITYDLTDANGDNCTVSFDYSVDSGSNWASCTAGGGDSNPQTGVSPGSGLTFIWDAATDLPAQIIDVMIRVSVDDGDGGTDEDSTAQFTIDTIYSGPVANFSASPTSGLAALMVVFTNLSSGTYDTCQWDFGDGGSSSDSNPTHVYNLVGTYTVTLTIDGPDGSALEMKAGYITVTDPGTITAEFTAAPTSGTAPLDVQFTDLSVGNVTSWSWSFGDGGTSTDRNPSYQYTADGIYDVHLTVYGPALSDAETKVAYITVTAAVIPPAKDSGGGGCSCSVNTGPVPASHLLGYFLPVLLIACAYLALRRRSETA